MSSLTIDTNADLAEVPTPELRLSLSHRFLTVIAIAAMLIGAGSILGGLGGAIYTWDQAADQAITTPDDAVFAEVPVRGPLSMWAQSDIITHHQLDSTEGLYYAEMDRMVPLLDETTGEAVVGGDGEVVMVPNEARASWLNATTLTTSLGLGIMAYALSAFAIVAGFLFLGFGLVFRRLRDAVLMVA